MTLRMKLFENSVGKGENAGNHFLLFPQCFLPFPKQISIFQSLFFCRLQMLPIWTGLKFCRLVKSKGNKQHSSWDPCTKRQNCRLGLLKAFTVDNCDAKMGIAVWKEKTLWVKEKIQVTCIFSSFHNVFKRIIA